VFAYTWWGYCICPQADLAAVLRAQGNDGRGEEEELERNGAASPGAHHIMLRTTSQTLLKNAQSRGVTTLNKVVFTSTCRSSGGGRVGVVES